MAKEQQKKPPLEPPPRKDCGLEGDWWTEERAAWEAQWEEDYYRNREQVKHPNIWRHK